MRENVYEKIIAAALLKFEKLDNMDIHIICKNIIPKLDNEKNYCLCNLYQNLYKFIKIGSDKIVDNGTISLRENFTLDSVIDKDYLLNKKEQMNQTIDEYYYDGITLRGLFERFSSNKIIKEYFDNLDIKKYYAEKEELLKKHKEELLNNGNVLLISDDNSEYDLIKNYGFKKIDWFKSQVVADNYFKEHQEELNKYHIYIRGSHPICGFKNFPFENELEKRNEVLRCSYFMHENDNRNCYEEYFQDELTHKSWEICSPNYNDILDNITTESLMKDVLNKVDKKYLDASLITIEQVKKKPVPEKKEDLKVQYLNCYVIPEFKDEISKELNLDITFNPDNNYGIENYIFKNIGDYDIIIASNIYSGKILRLITEAEEQLKCTGRKFALFLTYDGETYWYKDENGEYHYDSSSEKIILRYIFVGPDIVDSNQMEKRFDLIIDENGKKKKTKAILEAATEIYNDKLKEMGASGFEITDYKTPRDYEEEYQKIKEARDRRINSIVEPIKNFNKMVSTIDGYLNYKSWLDEDDKTFNIVKAGTNLITIEQLEDDKVVARITYKNKEQDNTYVEFTFSYLDNNHSIDDKIKYGFYTNKHENKSLLPEKPDQDISKKIKEFEEKVEEVLQPLCSKAWNKYYEHQKYVGMQKEKIEEFDRLYNHLLKYIKYTRNEIGNIMEEQFKISQNDEGIKVSLMFGNRCVGSVTFKKGFDNNSRIFLVEQINKKGVLSKSQTIGYSTDEKLKEPDEKQLIIINKVKDIINNKIVPLNDSLELKSSNQFEKDNSYKKLYKRKYRW